MPWYYDLGFAGIITLAGFPFEATALSKFKVFFVTPREGTVSFVVAGESFQNMIMSWKDHYLNRPGSHWHDPDLPDWEVLEVGGTFKRGNFSKENLKKMPRTRRLSIPIGPEKAIPFSPMALLDRYGVAYYGLWPLEKIHRYRFRWTEERVDKSGVRTPWRRNEMTDIMYVETFVYRVRLEGAENIDGESLDLDYLLSVRINNPYKARFRVTDWLERLTADANNAVKVWVGSKNFKQITQEMNSQDPADQRSGFVEALKKLNENLPTEHEEKGAPEVIGVTIVASSLQQVAFTGSNREALVKATNDVIIATREGEAEVIRGRKKGEAAQAEAEGLKQAAIAKAEGEKQAEILIGEGRAAAKKAVLTVVDEHPGSGLALSQIDAMAAPGEGKTVFIADVKSFADVFKGVFNPEPPKGPTTNDNGKE